MVEFKAGNITLERTDLGHILQVAHDIQGALTRQR